MLPSKYHLDMIKAVLGDLSCYNLTELENREFEHLTEMLQSLRDRVDERRHSPRITTQAYLKAYAKEFPVLNSNKAEASKVFSGAIAYAATVFINNLTLGGAYKNTKNYKEITEHLQRLCNLITRGEDE